MKLPAGGKLCHGLTIARWRRYHRMSRIGDSGIDSLRRECLDWIVIVHRRQLEAVVREYVAHYHAHRPHCSLGLRPPTPLPLARASPAQVLRHDRLSGLIHEYEVAA